MDDLDPLDETRDVTSGDPVHHVGVTLESIPDTIGRYRIDKVLGKGGFGLVYLAYDDQLNRPVAIKVPHGQLITKPSDADAYLTEARTVANLDHPHIVPVHDVGSTDDYPCFVVSKYVEGTDLTQKLKLGRLSYTASAELAATVAEALHYAHMQGLVHRDIKPGNILLDTDGKPYVFDFGLALREENIGKGPRHAGTPFYMSPEQARGEGHRVDGRSDIFSLGVVFYEMLVGRRPFQAETQRELLEQITTMETRPPRQINDSVPKELERICLKAIAKRASDRYTTALDFSDDLRHFLDKQPAGAETESFVADAATTTGSDSTRIGADYDTPHVDSLSQPIRIVPKGLRSFDALDADFFLELLPGPRDREGLPDSLRFWKTRIEETDPDDTFSIGLIYGPSGCGKSSLVKAGLLPRLSEEVISVYVEATPDDTETRLLHRLRKRCPALADNLNLKETLATLRRGQGIPVGKKVLIVLDQFEQWLHAKKEEENTELVQALRQCDGGRTQCIVTVRDDFWMAATRFMRELEIRLVEAQNSAAVDLFPVRHAHRVLSAFGRAFGALSEESNSVSNEQKEFLEQSVAGLVEENKVICVRLALFAEMMKGKSWTSATLKDVGGTEGVGVTFLEETFGASTAPPEHRLHQKAARAVLRSLLPDSGTDIKGEMKSYDQLLVASGYATRPKDFDDLVKILDSEIRLITPTDPESVESEDDSISNVRLGQRYYQLTHDYLVPSLRVWLTQKQKETHRGRAELKLEERAGLWNAKPENRYLPSLLEWCNIRALTDRAKWSPPQHAMMRMAGRTHGLRTGLITALLLTAVFAGLGIKGAIDTQRSRAEAARLVESLTLADTAQVDVIIGNLKDFRAWADPLLQEEFGDSADDSNARLHAGLALVAEGQIVDPQVLEYLRKRLLTVTSTQFEPVRTLLEPHKTDLIGNYWTDANDELNVTPKMRFHAACALAEYDSTNSDWSEATFAEFVAEQLVSVSPEFIGQYKELIRPVSKHLVPALSDIFKDSAREELARTLATSLLSDYAAEDSNTLVDLILDADVGSDQKLFPVLEKHRASAVKILEEVLDQNLRPDWHDQPLNTAWSDIPPSASARIEASHGLTTERFAFCQDMSWQQFLEVVELLRPSGYRPTRVRPWRGSDQVLAAAIWTRDDQHWELQTGVKKSDLPTVDSPAAKDDLMIADIAALPSGDQSADRSFIVLWSQPTTDKEQRRIVVGVTESELVAAATDLTKQGFTSQSTINVWPTADGQRQYAGIWSNHGAPSELNPAYAGFEKVHQPQWDVAVAAAGKLPDPLEQEPPARYAALWRADVKFESRLLATIGVEETLDQIKSLVAEDFRPVAVTVDEAGAASLVFHRPLIRDAEKEELALRQAAAATALLRMNSPEHVWPLFQRQPDPRLCSYLLNRLASYGVDPQSLLAQLQIEADVSRRRALIIGIGEFARAGLLSTKQQASAIKDLVNRYGEDPDTGVHGASEWALRQLGAVDEIVQVRDAFALGTAVGQREWYLTKKEGLSMAIIHPEDEFLMGSPISEAERAADEIRHRQRIGRTFAIGAHEVTVAQFQAFRRDYGFNRTYAREEDAPANMITWYDAAAFCNWLSDQEGITRDQWCYDSDQPFAEGMTLFPDYLQRTGYRLPTEAEWEYACRAGTLTSRYFGETETLLGEYAWYTKTSGDEWMLPVGALKPNGAGLFDMQGNIYEWCQERELFFDTDIEQMGDKEQLGKLNNSLRGGSFSSGARFTRSAYRNLVTPVVRSAATGFRVARTYP